MTENKSKVRADGQIDCFAYMVHTYRYLNAPLYAK